MAQKKSYELLKEKVPDFRSPWKSTAIFIVWFLLFLSCIVFFLWFDALVWYGALISQLIVALVCSGFAYAHMKNIKRYREKYGELAYRYFFFHFIMPIFATRYACMFHPLHVEGSALLPFRLAIVLGAFLILTHILLRRHIRIYGFDEICHCLGIYTGVSSEIYSYIRYPMYAGFFFITLGFAFSKNNLSALVCALIFLIPVFNEVRLKDKEMTERFGEEHKKYIKNTGALFPHKNIRKFLKLLFSLKKVNKNV